MKQQTKGGKEVKIAKLTEQDDIELPLRGKDESNRELVARLNDLATKWLMSKRSCEEALDHITLEQFLKILSDNVRVFVREGTSTEAAKLADDYLQARKGDLANKDASGKGDKFVRLCHRCGKVGHVAKDCRVSPVQKQKKVADQPRCRKG